MAYADRSESGFIKVIGTTIDGAPKVIARARITQDGRLLRTDHNLKTYDVSRASWDSARTVIPAHHMGMVFRTRTRYRDSVANIRKAFADAGFAPAPTQPPAAVRAFHMALAGIHTALENTAIGHAIPIVRRALALN